MSEAVTIDNGHLQATILRRGAAVQDLRLPDIAHPVILGHADPTVYGGNDRTYMGQLVGRVANRIAGGRAVIAGKTHQLDCNEGGVQTLHGGHDGTGALDWDIVGQTCNAVELSLTLPDGHMGFPGQLRAEVIYRLDGTALEVTITARCDAPTICSFAPHLYFNLSGSPDISDHLLQVPADTYLPVDNGIPTSDPTPVAGTMFDLRTPVPPPKGIDHNLCLANAPRQRTPIARMSAGGIEMEISSTEPGLQIYDGRGLDLTGGLDGRRYGPRAGIALEPQRWPDAVNNTWRAQTDLMPGSTYRAGSRFSFRRIGRS